MNMQAENAPASQHIYAAQAPLAYTSNSQANV